MRMPRAMIVLPVLGLLAAAAAAAADGPHNVLVEAESFADRGGWVVDQQFMDVMGSPYLLAHGLGRPVASGTTQVTFPAAGEYRLWVRTRDWVPSHHPGRFRVVIDGAAASETFGTAGDGWLWQDGGTVTIRERTARIELKDLTGFDGRCDALLLTTDRTLVPPNKPGPAMAVWRRKLLGLPATPPDAGRFDVVVVGGGIAGCSAAIAAARLGSSVALIQDRPVLGGNNSPECRVPTGGRGGPIVNEINRGRTARRRKAVEDEEGIRLFLGWHAYAVDAADGRIRAVDARNIFSGKELRFRAHVVIDCTGDGSIGFWAGADFRMGREGRDRHGEPTAPEKPDKMTLGTSLMWHSRKAEKPSTFPDVPWAAEVVGDYAAVRGPWSWEYGHHRDTIFEAEEIRDHLLRTIYGAFANARRQAKYADYELSWVPYVAAKRESRRLMGDYVLTEDDVKSGREFPDGVATGSWPIDLHYPRKGRPFRTYAKMDRVKPYPIPFRCLYSRNVSNLMMAGRDVSVTHVALGSTRVMNTCGQMGVAAGVGAHLAARHEATPRDVYEKHLKELKDALRGLGRTWRASVGLAPPKWRKAAGANLARDAEVAVDSCLDAKKYPPAAINDGKIDVADNNARWVSAAGSSHHVELTWKKPRTIGAARLVSGWTRGGEIVDPNRDFVLQAPDGAGWRDIPGATATGNRRADWSARFEAVTTDRIRLVVTAGAKDMARLWELELFGPVAAPAGGPAPEKD